MRFAIGFAFLLAAGARLWGQASDDGHKRVYQKTADSVVGIRAMAPLGERSGSGVVLTAQGLLLTSYAVCPEGSSDIRVWFRGPRRYTAEIVATSKKDEITLLRIKPRGDLKPVEMGSSAGIRVGQVSYTLGNAANSIIDTDQPSFNVGIISAVYRLSVERANSTYTGPVLETTAAVNVGMEGAPCFDVDGKMIGFVTRNYSPHRFLGTAIPIDEIRPILQRLGEGASRETAEASPAGEGSLGLRVKEEGGKLVVHEVDKNGPADREGLSKGDVLIAIGETPVKTALELDERLKNLEAGSIVWIKALVAGKVETIKLTLEKKK